MISDCVGNPLFFKETLFLQDSSSQTQLSFRHFHISIIQAQNCAAWYPKDDASRKQHTLNHHLPTTLKTLKYPAGINPFCPA